MPRKNKRKLEEVTTDTFLKSGLETDSEDEVDAEEDNEVTEADSRSKGSNVKGHKASLERLKQKDPEFYEFLQNEDKELLNFEDSEGESDEEGEEDDDDEDGDEQGRIHKLPSRLEVASDDSDESEEDDDDRMQKKKAASKKKDRVLVTMKHIGRWSRQLQETSLHAVHQVAQAFHAAVEKAGQGDSHTSRYRVEGSQVFNGIVRVCMRDMMAAVNRFLKLTVGGKQVLPSHCKNWNIVKNDVKVYLSNLLQLMSSVAEASILHAILKHINSIVFYFASFPKLTKALLKKMINIWSSGEEASRVLAFLSINKLIRQKQDTLFEPTLKQMYMAYVRNCKFTSPTSLPLINFMQHSLVEMFAINTEVTYQYSFVYIRQLAIHLRNAINLKKKENIQAVYNWQYVHSLHLWARLLSTLYPSDTLEPLIYPLTQTIIGTIKLVPTARYYPLRFHCVTILTLLCSKTKTHIPVLPFLLEVFEQTDFNKKHTSNSFKPFNFACMLKFSKAQLTERVYRDGLIDQLYELLMEYLHTQSHSICFTELTLPALLQMKQFLKTCKVANYTRQIKQIVDKIEETNKVTMQRRKKVTINLRDTKAIEVWEEKNKVEGTPLSKFYSHWRKLRDRELQHEIAGKDRLSHDEIPTVERKKPGLQKATQQDKKDFAELFETDSEDENDEIRFLPKSERPERPNKKMKKDDSEDDYSDLDSDEWEQLAQSASDDDDDGGGDDDDGDDDDDNDDAEEEEEDAEDAEKQDSDIPEGDDIVEDFEFSDSD